MGLKDLVEDYVIAQELGEHKSVSELSAKICGKLIEILDEDLVERDESESDFQTSLIRTVSSICDRIRVQDDIASAYHDVRSFVYLYDMVCFSRMVGAIPSNSSGIEAKKDPEHELAVDVDSLAFIMRSACHLLRYMNEEEKRQHGQGNLTSEESPWLDVGEQTLEKMSSVGGFPVYALNIESWVGSRNQLEQTDLQSTLKLVSSAASDADQFGGGEMGQILATKWFGRFVENTLHQTYPLDRFTLLVALWIVADICQCGSLEQLMSELVDQIFHEESNSCNVEELLQLGSQVGSFWLTYHRRHRASFARANLALASLEADDDSSEDEDRAEADELSQVSNRSMESVTDDTGNQDQLVRASDDPEYSRAKLRRIIKDELLEGPSCLVCGLEAREPLACLRQQQSCPKCGNQLALQRDFCALSRRALPLLRLSALESKAKQLVLVSQSEWTRQMLAELRPMESKGSASVGSRGEKKATATRISERIDIEANFERLTVIRDEDEELPSWNDSPDEDDEASEMESTLRSFMRQESSPAASESIRMMRFVLESSKNSSILYLCASDFLILDRNQNDLLQEQQLELRLAAASSSVLFARGNLWICNSRSSISRLKLGCGRLFSSLELMRHNTEATNTLELDGYGGFTCCFCRRKLSKVSSFPGELQLPTSLPAATASQAASYF